MQSSQLMPKSSYSFMFPIDLSNQKLKKQHLIIKNACLDMKVRDNSKRSIFLALYKLFLEILNSPNPITEYRGLHQKNWIIIQGFEFDPTFIFDSILKPKLKIGCDSYFYHKSSPNCSAVSLKSPLGSSVHTQKRKLNDSLDWSPAKSMIGKIIVPSDDESSFILNFPKTMGEWDQLLKDFPDLSIDSEIYSILQLLSRTSKDKSQIDNSKKQKIESPTGRVDILNTIGKSIACHEELISYAKKASLFYEEKIESWKIGEACFLYYFKQQKDPNTEKLSLNDVTEILSSAGRFLTNVKGLSSIGLLFHLEVLRLRRENKKPFAAVYTNIGICLRDLCHYKKALEYLQKALDLEIRIYGEKNANVARSYNNIGMIQNDLGDYQVGLGLIKEALKIQKKIFKHFKFNDIIEHPDVARSYHNGGVSWCGLNSDQKTSKYLGRAKSIREKIFGLEHPVVAITNNNLGVHLMNIGKYEPAMDYLIQALNMHVGVFGEKHPSVAIYYTNIALCAMDLKEYVIAKICLKAALEIRKQVLEEDHPDLSWSYIALGRYYRECKKKEWEDCESDQMDASYTKSLNRAIEYYRQALAILEPLNEPHPGIVICHENIWLTLAQLGLFDEARSYIAKIRGKAA